MQNTPSLLAMKLPMIFAHHIFGTEYIPYSGTSSCSNYGTLILSDETCLYNYAPALQYTLPGGVYSH